MKIVAYLRVSTEQQAESGAGLDAQQNSCLMWAGKQNQVIERFYSDEGISGSTGLDKRPALMEAIASLGNGDILLVAKRDRLGRDPIAVAMIEAAAKRKHAKIMSVAGEGSDSDDPTAVLMRRMVDAFAEFERNIIRERTSAAMQAKKRKNERVGHIPFGYRLAEDGLHIVKESHEQSILDQIKGLMDKGLSTRKIAEEMNRRGAFNRGQSRWNHGSIFRIMSKIAA
jgi:DNA invertase Pin-like site-specific DNA recombinase